MTVMNFEMHRNAHVGAEIVKNPVNNEPLVKIDIDGKLEHVFDAKSRVTQALKTSDISDIERRLNNGFYFEVDGQLVDFRDGRQNTFVHTDESIAALMDHIGASYASESKLPSKYSNTQGDVVLRSDWNKGEIVVPEYNEGGSFDSHLMFQWSPFNQNVNSMFYLVRLICTNGMVGLTNFLNSRIPVVNRWEEHLDIAAKQIQNKIDSKVSGRLLEMGRQHATVGQLQLIADHARKRANAVENEEHKKRLDNIVQIAEPSYHLDDVYTSRVFQDRNLSAQLPAHLDQFTAYNLATELNTHTESVAASTARALDKFASDLVFSPVDNSKAAARFEKPLSDAFSNPEAAFAGDLLTQAA